MSADWWWHDRRQSSWPSWQSCWGKIDWFVNGVDGLCDNEVNTHTHKQMYTDRGNWRLVEKKWTQKRKKNWSAFKEELRLFAKVSDVRVCALTDSQKRAQRPKNKTADTRMENNRAVSGGKSVKDWKAGDLKSRAETEKKVDEMMNRTAVWGALESVGRCESVGGGERRSERRWGRNWINARKDERKFN